MDGQARGELCPGRRGWTSHGWHPGLGGGAGPDDPVSSRFPANLKIVCNIGPAGLQTGQPEGFVLTIAGTPFVEGGAGGPFKPLHPEVGLTAFSPGVETAAFSTAWEQDFQRLHGRAPNPQDRADRLWSLDFATRNGRPPSDAEWYAHWWETQGPR